MAYRLVVCNNKGGVGKTNTAVNIAVFLVVEHGLRVRIVDLDPQADTSAMLRFEVDQDEDAPSVLEVIERAYVRKELVTGTAADAVQPCRWDVPWAEKLSFIPARFDLEEANHAASNLDHRMRLRAAMEGTDDDVDVIVYDCPPSLGVLPQMAWADADDLLLVTQPSFRSYRGMRRTHAELLYVREQLLVPDLDYCGFVINAQRGQTTNHQYWTRRIIDEFGPDRHWGTLPLRTQLARLDDQLVPVALMPATNAEDRRTKDTLTELYRPIVQRVHELATTTVTEEV